MKPSNRMLAVLSASLVLTTASCAFGQDWPQWRGSNRDAKAAGFTAPKTWPAELTQQWKVTVDQGDATPSLVGDKLYVFARQQGTEALLCLDAATGKEIWRDQYDALGATGSASSHSGPRSSPAVAEGKVVTVGVRGMLSCLDAATGRSLWRKDDFQAYPRFHPASSPIIVDGLCIAQLGGQGNGALVAYDLATGEEKWKWAGDSPAYASPVPMTVSGTRLIVAQTERRIAAVTAADGKLVWETPAAPRGRGYNAASPVVDGQTIYHGGSGRGTTAVRIEKQGDGFVAKELWSHSEKSVEFNTPVLKDGLLYGLTQGNEFFCIKAENGQTAWAAPVAPATDGGQAGRGGRGMGRGAGYGSIVDAGSVLLALTPASQLIAFHPSDKEYTELARIKVADTPTYAHLVVSGNRLFVKDQESLTLWKVE
jgi:outer membrane protein assembly factor BamB